MKLLLPLLLSVSICSASLDNLNSFQADFMQSVTDDKNATLHYSGSITAQKPQNVLWKYTTPIKKSIYINQNRITIVEPEIEQVIIKDLDTNLDFFTMMQNAKKFLQMYMKLIIKKKSMLLK